MAARHSSALRGMANILEWPSSLFFHEGFFFGQNLPQYMSLHIALGIRMSGGARNSWTSVSFTLPQLVPDHPDQALLKP